MKKGKSMLTLIVFIVGIGAALWAAFKNETKEDSAVQNYAEGLNHVREVAIKALTKEDFEKGMADVQASLNEIQLHRIPDIESSIKGSNTCVEEVFKRLKARESRQHLFDRKFASTKREISLTLNRPVPVEIVTKPPPPPKEKSKKPLLDKAGLK
jgi:hypothetical protein